MCLQGLDNWLLGKKYNEREEYTSHGRGVVHYGIGGQGIYEGMVKTYFESQRAIIYHEVTSSTKQRVVIHHRVTSSV